VIKFYASSSLKDQIANLESENECLRSQAAAVVEQKVHPEKIETDQEVSVVQQIQPRAIADNVKAQINVTLFWRFPLESFHYVTIIFYDAAGLGQWKSNRRRIACKKSISNLLRLFFKKLCISDS